MRTNHAAKRANIGQEKPAVTRRSILNNERPMPGKAILIVDDEPDVAMVLVEIFHQDGYMVDVAGNGMEALEKLQRRSFDIIVCDIRMPRLSGPDLYFVLAQWEPQVLTRMLFLTGDTLTPQTQAFLQQTGVPVLNKPFALENLRRAVQLLL